MCCTLSERSYSKMIVKGTAFEKKSDRGIGYYTKKAFCSILNFYRAKLSVKMYDT